MMNFLASLIVSTLLTVYIIFTGKLISLAATISWWFGLIVFVITLTVAIDFFSKRGTKR